MNAKIELKSIGNGSAKPPSARQMEILYAYLQNPNAAAVGRANRMSERNVRRIVQSFGPLLAEWRRERAEEQLARVSARVTRIEEWADATLPQALRRLGELAASSDEGVALRAIKMTLDILQGSALALARPESERDIALRDRAGGVIRRLEAAEVVIGNEASGETSRG